MHDFSVFALKSVFFLNITLEVLKQSIEYLVKLLLPIVNLKIISE